jgi:uncharacterized peroxidase-related enzyme
LQGNAGAAPLVPAKRMNINKKPLLPLADDQTFSDHQGRPNFLRILAHSRAALKACLLFDQVLAQGRLTPQQREQIALTVSEIIGCSYSLSMHCARSRKLGMSGEDIRLARKAKASSPQAKAMLRFTQVMVLQRGEISPEEFQALRQTGFSKAQIIEIITVIGQSLFTNYFNTAVRTAVDFPLVTPGMEGPDEVDPPAPGRPVEIPVNQT